ncbi:hypothetical protein DUNSADRAFT_15105 [Dunaliella salina]|uniref:Protein NO VEIN C-terminal domain-containing protein n=1 Tax=Dunaliella salina TaxID=3046 RepID=A0ABQ7H239_DUNSA|nr:hypothetical protein DUNSADRAFT_15105 [Dunaliella salina]|eukprot:KAF5840905.1 hypothetical protein DUNSADRAFT_15105 [Dunaliella salina]
MRACVYLQRHQADLAQTPVRIIWCNEQQESGLPFDLKVQTLDANDNTKVTSTRYIEVKASMAHDNKLFRVTQQEMEFAAKAGPLYTVARVTGAGSQKPQLAFTTNPYRLWEEKQLDVCLYLG